MKQTVVQSLSAHSEIKPRVFRLWDERAANIPWDSHFLFIYLFFLFFHFVLLDNACFWIALYIMIVISSVLRHFSLLSDFKQDYSLLSLSLPLSLSLSLSLSLPLLPGNRFYFLSRNIQIANTRWLNVTIH